MKRYYYYQVHNFRLRSTMPFPELWPIPPQQTEVTLREGNPPEQLKDPQKKGQAFNGFHSYEYKPGEFLLEIRDIGRCLIRKGTQVTVQKNPNIPEDQFRMYFLTSGIGYLLLLRGSFPLHASAVDLGKECILFMGDRGAGKSTTAAQFLEAGYSLLSDDVSILEIDKNGGVQTYPSLPVMKLWADSIEWMNLNFEELSPILPDFEKYKVKLTTQFTHESRPVRAIYILKSSTSNQIRIQSLKGFEKIHSLMSNVYRKVGIEIFDLYSKEFNFFTQVTQSTVEMKTLERPQSSSQGYTKLVSKVIHNLGIPRLVTAK